MEAPESTHGFIWGRFFLYIKAPNWAQGILTMATHESCTKNTINQSQRLRTAIRNQNIPSKSTEINCMREIKNPTKSWKPDWWFYNLECYFSPQASALDQWCIRNVWKASKYFELRWNHECQSLFGTVLDSFVLGSLQPIPPTCCKCSPYIWYCIRLTNLNQIICLEHENIWLAICIKSWFFSQSRSNLLHPFFQLFPGLLVWLFPFVSYFNFY